jgi:cytochrome b6-f complex iron-sulfur subunit
MKINRREFLILSAVFAAGCSSMENAGAPGDGTPRTVNAGPASNYTADGVYAAFRNHGFFIVRQGDRLYALSAVCTHRHCSLNVEQNRSFHCPCHGSTFDPDGHVTHGPARRDLLVYSTSINETGDLLVTLSG